MASKIFALLLLVPCVCLAWGPEGHKIVAQIAMDMLTPTASNIVNSFTNGGGSIVDAAPMADDYRATPEGKWSEPCHFCNLPRSATEFRMSYCPNFCVVKSINNYTKILQSEESNPFACSWDTSVEPCALFFLVHFVGDVHQPLHVSWADDEGGNKVKVSWYGEETDLHGVWDTKIIEKWDTDYQDAAQQLEAWGQQNPSVVQQYESDMNPIDWADESYYDTRTTCYNFTEGARPRDVPYLGDTYYQRNLPIVQQRLLAAGVRLGTLLNSILTG